MLHTKDIAIVILNWNGKDLLEKFLPSVLEYSDDAKIYVADNASTDDSVAFVSEHFPEVTVIQNSENGGYAKGYNEALNYVEEPLLCLLNSDIEVTKNWLKPITEEFNSDTNTAIIQPKLLDFNKKTHFEYAGAAGGFIDKFGYPYCRGRIFETIEEDLGQYEDTTEIFWASGACFFIRTAVFKRLNGFDASYFAHMEEIDLCWRAFNANFTVKYVGASTVYHVGGATLKNTNPEKTFLNFRNSLSTLLKNADQQVYLKLFVRLFLDGVAALRFLLRLQPKHFYAILRAHGSFYWHFFRLLKKRRESLKRFDYYNTKSIVWSYFVRNKQYFNCL